MPELKPHEVERVRRSVAMASPGAASGLTREQALAVLEQLQSVTSHRDNFDGGASGAGIPLALHRHVLEARSNRQEGWPPAMRQSVGRSFWTETDCERH